MMIRMGRTTMLILAAACVALAGTAMADSFFKQAVHTDAFEMMGQTAPEKNDTTTVWLTEGKACSQTGSEAAVIFDAKKGLMYMVDHEKKEYSVIPMDLFGGEAKEGAAESDEAAKMMQAMGGSVEITVTPTDETAKIGDWNATKYNVDMKIMMMPSKQELWATEDIKIDYAMFNAVSSGMMAQLPGFEKIVEEMKQVKGITVKSITRTSAMGGEVVTTTELLEYAEKDAPDGVFDIPEGYKKVEAGMGMGGK
jgi:hypothetical protein